MKKQVVFAVFKPVGLTPLDMVVKLKEKRSELRNEKIGYAGRLDPMAEGVLLLLVGEENKRRQKYLGLDKTYRAEVCFGVETDTYDILGIIKDVFRNSLMVTREELESVLNSSVGKSRQKYPPYSSKTIEGVRMYKLAREGKLDDLQIPEKEVEIYRIKLEELQSIDAATFKSQILNKLKLVNGDFRQDKILKSWKQFFEQNKKDQFQIATIDISCSSGTYIRSLAHEIGKKLGTGAFLYNLTRTSVGQHNLTNINNI
jgi:tRNA pseudouridine55 synthase